MKLDNAKAAKIFTKLSKKPPESCQALDLVRGIINDEDRYDRLFDTNTELALLKTDLDQAELLLVRTCLTDAGVKFEENEGCFMIDASDENLEIFHGIGSTAPEDSYHAEWDDPMQGHRFDN